MTNFGVAMLNGNQKMAFQSSEFKTSWATEMSFWGYLDVHTVKNETQQNFGPKSVLKNYKFLLLKLNTYNFQNACKKNIKQDKILGCHVQGDPSNKIKKITTITDTWGKQIKFLE